MAIQIRSLKWKWHDCSVSFVYRKLKLFSTGGGSFQEFGFEGLLNYVRHVYFWKWCFLTIKFRTDFHRIFFCRRGNKGYKELVVKAEKREVFKFLKEVEKS